MATLRKVWQHPTRRPDLLATIKLRMHDEGMAEVTQTEDGSDLLTVSEAARLIYVSADTIRRYADAGKLAVKRTPANHRRFRRDDVLALLTNERAA